jgi:hypothetical protein
VRQLSDVRLLQLRATYPVETAWAPAHVGDQLRQARVTSRHANLSAVISLAEATAAQLRGDYARAAQQQGLGESYQAMRDSYHQRLAALETAADDRATWEAATRQQRQAAVAADAELRRRHPDQPWEPLRSAEPEQGHAGALPPNPEELATRHSDFARKRAERDAARIPLGPHPEVRHPLAPRRSDDPPTAPAGDPRVSAHPQPRRRTRPRLGTRRLTFDGGRSAGSAQRRPRRAARWRPARSLGVTAAHVGART